METTGQRLINLLLMIQKKVVTTKSRDARDYASELGMAACSGYITTESLEHGWTNRWFITAKGMCYVEDYFDARMDIIGQNGNDGLHYDLESHLREAINEADGC